MNKIHQGNCTECRLCPQANQSILSDGHDHSFKELDSIKKIIRCHKGEVIFSEGSNPKGLYCIRAGKVKLTQMGTDGKSQIVEMLKNGDIMGHRAIFGNDVYNKNAIALEDSTICFFPKDLFYNLVETDGKLILRIAHLLATELKEAEKRITSSAQQSVMVRVSESLLILRKKYGLDTISGKLNIQITREDLANMAGTTRETATRSLYKLQELGMIRLSGKSIIITDEKKLSAMTS